MSRRVSPWTLWPAGGWRAPVLRPGPQAGNDLAENRPGCPISIGS